MWLSHQQHEDGNKFFLMQFLLGLKLAPLTKNDLLQHSEPSVGEEEEKG